MSRAAPGPHPHPLTPAGLPAGDSWTRGCPDCHLAIRGGAVGLAARERAVHTTAPAPTIHLFPDTGRNAMTGPKTLLPFNGAHRIQTWNGAVGARHREERGLVNVTLPTGWTTRHSLTRGLPGWLVDQHGRSRAVITCREHSLDGRDSIDWLEPRSHALAVAEDGVPLVLDSWAQPAALIAAAAERVQTFHQIISVNRADAERWRSEMPQHVARLDAEHDGYQRTLAAYTALFNQLADALRSGWTIRKSTAATPA